MSKSPREVLEQLPDFRSELIRLLEALVGALPEGVAHLSVGCVPDYPAWVEPYFEIISRNPRAAPVQGTPLATDLHVTVGNSWREFYGFARGGTIVPGA